MHCSPIMIPINSEKTWRSSTIITPFSMIASLLCSITGEKTELIVISSSPPLVDLIYEYSGWHNTLLIDYDQSQMGSQFLKFSTQCNIFAYRSECIIEVKMNITTKQTEDTKSTLFIIINHIINFLSIPIYLTIGFFALFITFKK